MDAAHPPRVSAERLWQTLEQYARIGATAEGGVTRTVFSATDVEARRQLVADGRALGLDVRVDAAANVFCTRGGADTALPLILMGSHLDSVPGGGRYDGALGVICGLEVLRTLEEQHVTTRHAVGLASFSGEEATAYGTSTFGSRALAGRLQDVADSVLPDGRTVRRALAESGGAWEALATVRDALGPLACFLEVHIEQGRRLEAARQPLAVVSGVTGICRQRLVFRGESGHAGTTAMDERHDALRAAARFTLAVAALPRTVAASDPDATATVGFLDVSPNAPNVIPGQVVAVSDLRSSHATLLAALAEQATREARRAAEQEGTGVEVGTLLEQAPVSFDARIRAALSAVLAGLGTGGRELASQAGHDAVNLAALAPSGMLFVRCKGGVSHRPEESITAEDAALAAQALLQAVLALDASPSAPDAEK